MGLLCSGLSLFGQTVAIKGVVQDERGQPLPFANIQLLHVGDQKLVSYAVTDSTGRFSMKARPGRYVLKTSFIGYDGVEQMVDAGGDQRVLDVAVTLNESENRLDEVVVNLRAVEVLGDTLRYRLSMFTDSTETNLKESLEKLPGFEISEQGEISVNGKKVDKVLLDGDDFMNDQIGIALETLPGAAAKDVDYIKNYTESRTNRGMGSEKTALDIKLKESQKNRWKGESKAGIGMDSKGYGLLDNYNLNKKFKVFYVGEFQNIGSRVEGMRDYHRALGPNLRRSNAYTTLNLRNGALSSLGNIMSLGQNDVNERASLVQTMSISGKPNDKLKLSVSGVFSRAISDSFTSGKRNYFDRSHTGVTEQHFHRDIDDDKNFFNTGFTAIYMPSDDFELYCNFRLNGMASFYHRLQTQEGVPSDQLNKIRADNYVAQLEINDRFGEKSLGNIAFYANVGNDFSKYRLSSETAIALPEDRDQPLLKQQNNTYTSEYAVVPGYTYRSGKTNWSLRSLFSHSDRVLRTQNISDETSFVKPQLQTQAIATEFAAEKNEEKIQYRFLPKIAYREWVYQQGYSHKRSGYFFEPLLNFEYHFRDFHYLGLTYKRANEVYDLQDLYRGFISDDLGEYKVGGLDLDYSTNVKIRLRYVMIDQISRLHVFGYLTYHRDRNKPTVSTAFDRARGIGVITSRVNPDSESYSTRLYASKTLRTKIPLRIGAGLNFGIQNANTYVRERLFRTKNTDYGGNFRIRTRRDKGINLGARISYSKNKNEGAGRGRTSDFDQYGIGGFIRGETIENIWVKLRCDYSLSESNDARRELSRLGGRIWYEKPKGKFRYAIKMENILNLDNPLQLHYKNTDSYQQETLSSLLPGYILAEVKYRF